MDIVASGLRGFRLLDSGSSMVTVVTWRSQKLVGGSAQQSRTDRQGDKPHPWLAPKIAPIWQPLKSVSLPVYWLEDTEIFSNFPHSISSFVLADRNDVIRHFGPRAVLRFPHLNLLVFPRFS